MKKKMLSIDKMIEIEDWIEKMQSTVSVDSLDSDGLLKELKLKLEYVDQKDFPADTEAELRPCNDDQYYGLIRLNKSFAKTRFAYMHEIIHYLMDVGIGKKVTTVFSRKTKGNTTDYHEQEVNYATAASVLKYKDMKDDIVSYDKSKPKMDEIVFIENICKKTGQERTTVIRRIQEVRKLMRKRMTSY